MSAGLASAFAAVSSPFRREPTVYRTIMNPADPAIPPTPPPLSETILQDLATVHPQNHSPLFTTLPPELRNKILALTLTSHPDPTKPPFSRHTHYTRPGHWHASRITPQLLGSCKRVYLETHLLPIFLNEHVFRCYRGPRRLAHSDAQSSPEIYFARLTDEQKRAVREVRLYTQQYWLEGAFFRACHAHGLRENVKKITITLRHGDWWHWETNSSLEINPRRSGKANSSDMVPVHPEWKQRTWQEQGAWGSVFWCMKSLEEVCVEFETLMRRKAEMERVLGIAKTRVFEAGEGAEFRWDGEIVEEEWEGSARFDPDWTGGRGARSLLFPEEEWEDEWEDEGEVYEYDDDGGEYSEGMEEEEEDAEDGSGDLPLVMESSPEHILEYSPLYDPLGSTTRQAETTDMDMEAPHVTYEEGSASITLSAAEQSASVAILTPEPAPVPQPDSEFTPYYLAKLRWVLHRLPPAPYPTGADGKPILLPLQHCVDP